MASLYYYLRNHQQFGPVTSAQLRELAESGDLLPDDLLWKAGMEKAEPASKFKGLFPKAEPAAGNEPRPVATPALVPAESPLLIATSAQPPGRWGRMAAIQPVLDRYSRQLDITRRPLVALALGSAGLVLLFLSTLLTWGSLQMTGGAALPYVTSESYLGLEVVEGKLVGVLILLAFGFLGVALFVKRLLPAAILVAAVAGTCSSILALSYRHQILRELAEEARVLAQFGGQVSKEMFDLLAPHFTGGPGLGMYMALLVGLGVSAAFTYASFRKPLVVPFLQREGLSPFLQRHGALLAAQALALLIGLALYVARY